MENAHKEAFNQPQNDLSKYNNERKEYSSGQGDFYEVLSDKIKLFQENIMKEVQTVNEKTQLSLQKLKESNLVCLNKIMRLEQNAGEINQKILNLRQAPNNTGNYFF